MTTALAKKAYENNVSINWQESRVTKQISNINELYTAETIQMYKGKPNAVIINEGKLIVCRSHGDTC